jgi:hypothetical protein
MPLVSLEQVKPLVSGAMFTALNREDNWSVLEAEAAKIVRDESGITIPENEDDAPDWVVTPMAQIISKLGLSLLSELTPEYVAAINDDYDRAIKTARSHAKGGDSVTGATETGEIRRMVSW